METIYIHTHFLDTKMLPFFFFPWRGGGFSNIDFYCVKHNTLTWTSFASLYCRRRGLLFQIQNLVHNLEENYM